MSAEHGDATVHTAAANEAVARKYKLSDPQDFEDASRGLIATLDDPLIKTPSGHVAWDATRFEFIKGDAPASVNPSLWRQEKLNNIAGLFKVVDGIYQVRGYDLSNLTLIRGNTGWILIDPVVSAEVAKASLELAFAHVERKPVVAVIYTHSHIDHFGGVRGVVDEADVKAGKVPIIAPEGFLHHAVSENVLAGNAMFRRADFMYGRSLPFGPHGNVGCGLGKAGSDGTIGLIAPTDIVSKTGEERVVDGVQIVFQMANGSEAPSEFQFYFPDFNALCLSEVVTANQHNIYTLRGAQIRDALGWSKYINEAIDLFPDATVAFRSHHWPVWTTDRIRRHLENQRDVYRFLHDTALHLANQGYTPNELSDWPHFPKDLTNDFSVHGYYGTVSHNLRAVYNFYLGFYDGNPANLHPLPPVEAGKRYVEAIGGPDAVLGKAQVAFQAGEYRWAAELNNHLVFADPSNKAAKILQADILEQLGYQAESGPWRNVYLVAAQELREQPGVLVSKDSSKEIATALTPDMIFDLLAIKLDHQKVDGKRIGINVTITDTGDKYALELSNGVLNHTPGRVLKKPNVTLTVPKLGLLGIAAHTPIHKLVGAGVAKVDGSVDTLAAVFDNLVAFERDFRIVTP